jgi:hypothetical protein
VTEIGGRDGVGLEYAHHNRILLRNHPHYSERWLQERIVAQPSILGLGEVDVRAVERSQPAAGRLDLLLSDPSTETRYEVELQLGATNETHIIRTIEYWDIERKRYPQYDHVGVIVAEEITARFFNVISLFNGFIPLIAIQLYAVELDGKITLVFTKVLDRVSLGLEEEEASGEVTDRSYWERRSTPPVLHLVDDLLTIIRDVEPRAGPATRSTTSAWPGTACLPTSSSSGPAQRGDGRVQGDADRRAESAPGGRRYRLRLHAPGAVPIASPRCDAYPEQGSPRGTGSPGARGIRILNRMATALRLAPIMRRTLA